MYLVGKIHEDTRTKIHEDTLVRPKTVNGQSEDCERPQIPFVSSSMDNQLMGPDVACWCNRVMRLKTSDNETGYLNVLKQKDAGRKKPYYAKFLPPGERKQRTLPGSSSETAWEAAAKLAFHLEAQLELPAKEIRGLRRPNEVSCLSLPSPFERSVFSPCGSCVQECRLERLENAAKK